MLYCLPSSATVSPRDGNVPPLWTIALYQIPPVVTKEMRNVLPLSFSIALLLHAVLVWPSHSNAPVPFYEEYAASSK